MHHRLPVLALMVLGSALNPGLDSLSAAESSDNTAAIGGAKCAAAGCARIGGFSPPFTEPRIPEGGDAAPEAPANPLNVRPADDRCRYDENGRPLRCKPTAGSVALLGDNRVLYFNALEGTER